jgi:predicted transcriptional regulator
MVVASLALAATLYLFFRVLLVGTISRAKTRLNTNENRNAVLRFIVDNPGVTAVDVSKTLKMNLGTARYHLFILTANHRIITHKEDGKFLRYFTNAGTYTERERSLLSLMRREPLMKILKALAERPGLSNLELAKELDVSTASVHENITELYARGIVDRAPGSDRGYAYVIRDEYRPHVQRMMQRF